MTTTETTKLSATTYTEDVNFCYNWNIRNISFLLKDTELIDSSHFKITEKRCYLWYCVISQADGCVQFGLICNSCDRYTRIPAEFKFSLNGPKGEVALAGPSYQIFQEKNFAHYVPSLLSKVELLKYKTDPEDTLTIVCRVRAMFGKQTSIDKTPPPDTLSIPACKLQNDLETIFKNQQFTDVTLVVEGHSIKAHKLILAARSPVFAAMFNTDMKENRQNQVTITDMEYEVAQNLLQFIYTGKTEIASNTVDQLLVAADKYGLMRLKAQCEQTILNTLTVPMAIKTLIFADRMNTQQLKARAMKLIKTNRVKVVDSADWKTMAVEYPTLLVEVCLSLASV